MTMPVCPNCLTSYALRKRIRKGDFVCTHCGHVFFEGKIEEKKAKKEEKNV